jgi:hypothetical protein
VSVVSAHDQRNIRALLTTEEFNGVSATVLDNNPGIDAGTAGRIVDEALKFVTTAAQFRTVPISPSHVVDEGWHALILHTALYARLCERLGSMVHHYPERPDASRHDDEVMAGTIALIGEAGYEPDMDLWRSPDKELVTVSANCSHTPKPGGCGPIGPEGPRHCSSGIA